MAHIFPTKILGDNFHNSYGEKRIFETLKQLDDDWYILYSLNWQRRDKQGKIRWGEADFAILHRSYGIMVIEVKSGGIRYKNGEWVQTRLDTGEEIIMKDPFIQADRSKYTIIDLLNTVLPYERRCLVEKAVWFPSVENLSNINLPPNHDQETVLTSSALENPAKYLTRAFNYYNAKKITKLANDDIKTILDILLPEFNLIPTALQCKAETDYSFLQLTNEQKKILDFIDMNSNILIQGAAGTGKTLIATEEAARLADEKENILFLCFNRYLYEHLKIACTHDGVDYYSLHSFLARYTTDDLFDEKNLITTIQKLDLKDLGYKHLIIDEAQDFSENILEAILQSCAESNIKSTIYYDKNQAVFSKKLASVFNDFDCKLKLSINCRNTLKIQHTANSPLGLTIENTNGTIPGTMPIFFYANNRNEIISQIRQEIDKYLARGYKKNEITILTLTSESESIIKENTLGEYVLCSNPNRRQDDEILFTSAKKFKGLESDIVIIVDFDEKFVLDNNLKKVFYVAASRARQVLSLFYLGQEEDVEQLEKSIGATKDAFSTLATALKVIVKKIKQ